MARTADIVAEANRIPALRAAAASLDSFLARRVSHHVYFGMPAPWPPCWHSPRFARESISVVRFTWGARDYAHRPRHRTSIYQSTTIAAKFLRYYFTDSPTLPRPWLALPATSTIHRLNDNAAGPPTVLVRNGIHFGWYLEDSCLGLKCQIRPPTSVNQIIVFGRSLRLGSSQHAQRSVPHAAAQSIFKRAPAVRGGES